MARAPSQLGLPQGRVGETCPAASSLPALPACPWPRGVKTLLDLRYPTLAGGLWVAFIPCCLMGLADSAGSQRTGGK